MKGISIVVNSKTGKNYSADIIVYCIGQKKKDTPDFSNIKFKGDIIRASSLGDFKGEENDVLIIYDEEDNKKHQSKRIACIGIGQWKDGLAQEILPEKMRTAGGNIAKLCKKTKAAKVCVVLPESTSRSVMVDAIYGITEGLILGDYSFEKYKTDKEKKDKYKGIKEIRFLAEHQLASLRKAVGQARIAALSACHARNMANEPGSSWIPDSFAKYAKDLADQYQLKCKIFDKKQLIKLGMGGILAVNQGSDMPPKLIVLEHIFSKKAKTVLFVGKGLTFDSGGVSLKPAAGMEDMKYDMCGGAAVLSAMNVVGIEKPKCNVVAIVPATENMAGGSAIKPADIIYHYNGSTSEVINTDAEGRLILADALAYGIDKYAPDYVIDLATLTGAVIVGLGHHRTGLFSNNDKLAEQLVAAGEKSGEPLWRLPLGKEYKKQLESKVADIKNTGGKGAGAITAAEYLHTFVGKTPWAHLDIAGTAWNFTEKSYVPEGGPSGIGVRTLIEFLRSLK